MAEKIDLNRASVGDLEKIPGITRTLAERIVATRDRQGGFATLAPLRDINGVTADLFAVMKEHVAVEAAAAQDKSLVVRVNLDPQGQHKGGYGGYKVTAELVALTVLPGTQEQVAVPRAISTDASANGLATLTLPDPAAIEGTISFIVRAPDGQILERAERAKSELRETLPLPVAPRGLPTTQPADDPAFKQPTKLRGRVIDRAGRVQIAGKQVLIWTATVDNPQDADFATVMVATTDGTGYFSGPYPIGKFTSAHATVALDPTQAVAIRLTDGGTMPADVILVVDAPRRVIDQQGKDCGCDGPMGTTPRNPDAGDLVNGAFSSDIGQGRCVDFTRPDRTLQEFSYSYVVRTTEPSIKGLTLAEPTRIPPSVLGEIIKLSNLSVLASANARVLSAGDNDENRAAALRLAELTNAAVTSEALELHADVWRKAVSNPDKASAKSILDVAKTSKYLDIVRAIDKSLVVAPDRTRLSCRNPVDWDDDPTIYQACTIAHGHILHFKQEWIADGYSMGRLLYSLPLAPGQKKQIAVLDWERRESAIRQEALEETESLQATLSRDRDIGEMVSSVLSESSRGGSSASTSAVAGGIGIGAILGPVGGLLGIGGGASNANSTAWQNSSRNVAANSLQTLRDRTSQAAASMRAQRSTVIQTVTQGERVAVTTESVANYNHCHAMTMEYFEVLRHLIVRQRIVDVQECLFVPLQMSRFNRAKALRWRHTLKAVMPERALKAGFDALERIDNNYEGSDMPTGAYANERLDYLEGELTIRFQLARPRDNDQDDFNAASWVWMGVLLPMLNPQELYRNFLKGQTLKDRIFIEQVGPRIARAFVDLMKVSWVDTNDVEHPLPIDTTLLSNFTNDTQLAVSLRLSGAVPPVARKDIKFIKISEFAFPGIPFLNVLPANSRVIVDGGQMSYRTKFSSGYLFRSGRIANDLTGSDSVRVYTPLTLQELRKPREEDKELARRLLDHLNENIERYHHALWWRMSPDRRYMLLDGFEAPNSDGRSVASVVDNTLIGIVGNSLVMPVSRGYHLDPTFNQDVKRPIDLLEHYQPNTPIEPVRVAIPTRGVYAEAVMGACNSCETKEEERFWRWEESPIPDNPPAILPVSTESRQTPAPNLAAKDFPAPIIAMQSAPAAPDPTGLAGALTLLGQSGLFKDITGLEGNQKNAAAALQSAFDTAQFFGGKAADLALQGKMAKDIDKAMRTIQSAKESGLITDAQAQELTKSAISGMIGGGTQAPAQPMTTQEVQGLTKTAGANDASVSVSRPGGEIVSINAKAMAGLKKPLEQRSGFFGPGVVISETDLRDAIRIEAVDERDAWFDAAGNALTESDNSQFGRLVFYWLARASAIHPTTLTAAQALAISAGINYGQLLNDAAGNAVINAEAARVRADLLAGAPDAGGPANLNGLVEQAIRSAMLSRRDANVGGPWSAVFVVSSTRRTAIQLGLEAMSGGEHVGRDALLLADSAHRVYVREAYLRRFGPNRRDGTYHAFQTTERSPQIGDIIVQDRQTNNVGNVVRFDDIPVTLAGGYKLHADIVIEVAADHVVAMGGNLGSPSEGVRRRRYPLGTTGQLVVDRTQLYTGENASGNLPGLPVVSALPAPDMDVLSTARIFALLSLVQFENAVVPGQQVNGGVLV